MFNRLEALRAGRALSATLQDAQGERQYYVKTLKDLAHLLIDKNLPRRGGARPLAAISRRWLSSPAHHIEKIIWFYCNGVPAR